MPIRWPAWIEKADGGKHREIEMGDRDIGFIPLLESAHSVTEAPAVLGETISCLFDRTVMINSTAQ